MMDPVQNSKHKLAALIAVFTLLSTGNILADDGFVSCIVNFFTAPLFSEVEQIARKVAGNQFTVSRSLQEGGNSYARFLGLPFLKEVKGMMSVDKHWIDAGAGTAQAMREYFERKYIVGPRMQLTAVSKYSALDQIPPHERLGWEKFRKNSDLKYHADGRGIQQYSVEELGKADLVTDVAGALVWDSEMDIVLAKYIELLKPEGKLYSVLIEQWKEPTLKIIDEQGVAVDLLEFLKSIQGVEVITSKSEEISPRVLGFQFSLKRTSGPVKVPELKLVEVKAPNSPRGPREIPSHVYRWVGKNKN